MPTSSDDEVLLGLLKLTVDSEFSDRKVFFSRYELLRALRWSTEGRSYSRLTKALDRLSGVRIKATNAFYDNDAKSHSTRNFGIVDAYEINDGRAQNTKPSFFIWSETLFKSFKVGFIKKLDLDFYLNLRSAVAKRLYRYLDKHFWYRANVEMNLFVLAHEKIGISRTYQHVSSLRQQLDPAFEELIKAGFIENFSYSGKGTAATVSISAQRGARSRTVVNALPSKDKSKRVVEPKSVDTIVSEPTVDTGIEVGAKTAARSKSGNFNSDPAASNLNLVGALVARGLRPAQVEKLLADRSDVDLQRISAIVTYFDHLVQSRSHLVNRSPIGFLYRAVEKPSDFVLPGEGRTTDRTSNTKNSAAKIRSNERSNTQQGSSIQGSLAFKSASRSVITSNSQQPIGMRGKVNSISQDLESRYLVERKREIENVRAEFEPSLIASLRAEVEGKMGRVRDLITAPRFSEAVELVVDDKLLKLAKFPEFPEWQASQLTRSRRS